MTCAFVNLVFPSRGESHRRRLGDATQPNRAPGSTPQDLPAILVPEPRFTILMDKEAKRTSADPKELEKTPSSPPRSQNIIVPALRDVRPRAHRPLPVAPSTASAIP
jgi:hypothetical protein